MLAINYKTLFEVNLYHDYFLDNGMDKFAAMYAADRLVQLGRYNVSDFLEIVPTEETRKKLANQRMRLIQQTGGFRVMVSVEIVPEPPVTNPPTPPPPVPPIIPISAAFKLQFLVRIKDEFFANYTDLPFDPTKTYLFTNLSPYGGFPVMPLMPTLPEPPTLPTLPNIDGTFLANEVETASLLEDLPLAERIGLLGMFSITIASGNTAYDILSEDGEVENDYATFLVHIQNIKRYWKYKKTKTNQIFQTNSKLPLVKYGYIELVGADFTPTQVPEPSTYCYPNADVTSIEKDGADIYSVIFI